MLYKRYRYWNGCHMQPFPFFMKKFITLIIFSLTLVIAEYFLVNELFFQKRIIVIISCLLVTFFSIFAFFKFFKKNILHSKHRDAQN